MVDEILKNNKEFLIYGAGVYGRRVADSLGIKGYNVVGFVVSKKNEPTPEAIDGCTVYAYDHIPDELSDNAFVFVAVNETLHNEIRSVLNEWIIPKERVYFLKESEVCSLYRNSHPVDAERIFHTADPVSKFWGFDRGTPIDRYFIEGFLERESEKYQDVHLTLEVGEDTYSRRFFPDAEHEILDYAAGMDLTKEGTIPDEKYDMFICTQTFHQIYEIRKAIKGSWNLLKNGGVMLATVCGTIVKQAKCDEYDHFWGFTVSSITRLMKEVYGDNVTVTPFGNAMVATAFIQGMAIEDLDPELIDQVDDYYTICISIVAKKVTV